MTQIQSTAAGNRYNFAAFLDSDGFMTGSTKNRPTAGTSTNGGMLRFPGAKQASPTVQNPAPVLATGEDGYLRHEYLFPSDASRGFEISLAAQDLAQSMVIQNMPVNTIAGFRYGYEDIEGVQIPNMCLLLQSWAIDVATGVKKWSGKFMPNVLMTYLGRDAFSERTPAAFRYFATPQPSNYSNWGYTIFDSDGTQKAAAFIPFENSPYPVTMHALQGNAIATVFPLDYQPVNVASTFLSVERVERAITSVQTATPFGLTATSAPNGRGISVYQFRG